MSLCNSPLLSAAKQWQRLWSVAGTRTPTSLRDIKKIAPTSGLRVSVTRENAVELKAWAFQVSWSRRQRGVVVRGTAA